MAAEATAGWREGRTLLVGAGNPSRRDDGVGIHVVRRLVAEGLPEGCEAMELHGGWLDLVGRLHSFVRLIVVDAVDLGLAPGTVVEVDLAGCRVPEAAPPPGGHAVGLLEALEIAAATELPVPGEVRVLGIQLADAGSHSEELSSPVAAVVGEVCLAVRHVLVDRPGPGPRVASPVA